MNWIPVSERLPDDDCRCLVVKEWHRLDGTRWIDIERFRRGTNEFETNVLFWMPLPEPPKEGT